MGGRSEADPPHIDLYALPGDDGLVFPSTDGEPMRRSNFRRRVWEPATAEVGMTGFRFHDLRHTAATLAAASGTSLKALMARIGHASVAAALRYQHVIDGQDADIVRYLERFGEEPPVPSRAHDDTSMPISGGHVVGTPAGPSRPRASRKPLTRTFVVETMGLEPTTPCLQSRRWQLMTWPVPRKCWSDKVSGAPWCPLLR